RTFRHLTARDGGNAKGLLGTILALSVAHTRGCFCCGRCAGTHKCRERIDAQERQKSPKPFCPAVDIQGRINAACGWIR
ncbi:MAG: hypothetical protein V3V96_08840, partial [Acidiferrobacterales bacterium]